MIYVKCYLIYPGKKGGNTFIKMKTSPVKPCEEPEFDDQVIAIMGKSVLESVTSLEVGNYSSQPGKVEDNNVFSRCVVRLFYSVHVGKHGKHTRHCLSSPQCETRAGSWENRLSLYFNYM